VRLGVFGGSFDPPHIGHLLAAIDAFEALSLDHLIWIPAAVQPLKIGRAAASPQQRLEMVRRLLGRDPRFSVDSIEIDREGLSYTVDTLDTFARKHPSAERFFLVGADAVSSFSAWREPDRIAQLARVVVLRRPGSDSPIAAEELPGDAILLRTRLVDVSSTEIRERARTGKSIVGFVPESVAEFIAAERLYR
jgi:nicotinate-nucleotide adenylyltransferase